VSDQTLHLSLDWDGASLKQLTWRDLQELVRALQDGAKLLSPEVDVSRLLPLELAEGSVIGKFRIPESAKVAVARILKGPQKDWSARDFNAAEPLQAFMRKRNATAVYRFGRAREREIRIIDQREAPPATRAQSRFFVFVAGLGGSGDIPSVSLRIGGTRKVRAIIRDDDILRKLGPLFWNNAYVTLDYALDPVTGDMFKAEVVSVERYRHRALLTHVEGGGTIDLAAHYLNTDQLLAERRHED